MYSCTPATCSLLTLYSSIHFSWLLLICLHPITFTTPGRPPSNAPQVRAPGPNTMGQDFFLAFCLQPTQFDLDSTKKVRCSFTFSVFFPDQIPIIALPCQSVVRWIFQNSLIDFSKWLYGYVKAAKWFCYMDLSNLFYVFLALCQTKPS